MARSTGSISNGVGGGRHGSGPRRYRRPDTVTQRCYGPATYTTSCGSDHLDTTTCRGVRRHGVCYITTTRPEGFRRETLEGQAMKEFEVSLDQGSICVRLNVHGSLGLQAVYRYLTVDEAVSLAADLENAAFDIEGADSEEADFRQREREYQQGERLNDPKPGVPG